MGQLIKGDPRVEPTYSITEISLATGVKKNTLHERRRKLGISPAGRYTYQQAVSMSSKPRPAKAPNYQKIDALKARMKEDGYL